MTKGSKEYDKAILKKYIEFVGKSEVKRLTNAFTVDKFAGEWVQAMCSRSTRFIGTGSTFSSVKAKYTVSKNGLIDVVNAGYDDNFVRVEIKGISRARIETYPTCRTVLFNNLPRIEGDYWILFATPSFKTIIVGAPLIIKTFNRPFVITNKFGFYVLTRDMKYFWDSPEEHKVVFDVLKTYGFVNYFNKPVATAETYVL